MLADESREICREKVKLRKIFTESENFFGNRGKFEPEGNASLPQRMDAPECINTIQYLLVEHCLRVYAVTGPYSQGSLLPGCDAGLLEYTCIRATAEI